VGSLLINLGPAANKTLPAGQGRVERLQLAQVGNRLHARDRFRHARTNRSRLGKGLQTISDLSQTGGARLGLGRPGSVYLRRGPGLSASIPTVSDLYLTLVQRIVEGDTCYRLSRINLNWSKKSCTGPEFKILHYRSRL